jgi:hypothetical protein
MKKRLILLDLPGGLGNQLFAYFFATSLPETGKNKYFLNTRYIDLSHSNGKSTIKGYRFEPEVTFFDLGFLINRLFEPFKRHLGFINKFPSLKILILDDSNSSLANRDIHKLIEKSNPKVVMIFGFWQNLDYFNSVNRPVLRNPSNAYLDLIQRIQVENPVVFHYRLGRKNGAWEHAWGALDAEYLRSAMVSLRTSTNVLRDRPVWVFSNDLPEAREILSSMKSKIEFVDDSSLSPCELFEVLAASKSLVCSNSTFSILAAKVGQVMDVVIPRELSRRKPVNIPGIPSTWIRVNSTWLE